MKSFMALVFVLILASGISFAQEKKGDKPPQQSAEEKELSAMLSAYLNRQEILAPTAKVREYVEVSREKYPGLEFELTTPLDLASRYRPNSRSKFKQSDSYLGRLYDYTLTGTARPHQSGRLFEVTVPD